MRTTLFILCLLCLAATEANAQGVSLRSEPLPLGQKDPAPLRGYARFCFARISDCKISTVVEKVTLTDKLRRDLIQVNQLVNDSIKYTKDLDLRGRAAVKRSSKSEYDHWSYPKGGQGDCEDFALEKRRLLEERGVPRSALPIAVVQTSKGTRHALLVIRTDRGDFVLDLRLPGLRPWKHTSYKYVWVQSVPTKVGGWFDWMTVNDHRHNQPRQ